VNNQSEDSFVNSVLLTVSSFNSSFSSSISSSCSNFSKKKTMTISIYVRFQVLV